MEQGLTAERVPSSTEMRCNYDMFQIQRALQDSADTVGGVEAEAETPLGDVDRLQEK